MSTYSPTPQEKFAIFTVHGEVCYICRTPVDLRSMEVDHVIPERLLKTPEELQKVLQDLGRLASFDINGYENLLPACERCNGIKGGMIWDASLLVQLCLQVAQQRAPRVRDMVNRQLQRRDISRGFNILEHAIAVGMIPPGAAVHLSELFELQRQFREEELRDEAVVVTHEFAIEIGSPRIKLVRAIPALVRRKLLAEYKFSCAVTGPADPADLEIAALIPMSELNARGIALSPTSFIVLRREIHRKYDCFQIAIDPETSKVLVSMSLEKTELAKYHGRDAFLPANTEVFPDRLLLAEHLQRLELPLI